MNLAKICGDGCSGERVTFTPLQQPYSSENRTNYNIVCYYRNRHQCKIYGHVYNGDFKLAEININVSADRQK